MMADRKKILKQLLSAKPADRDWILKRLLSSSQPSPSLCALPNLGDLGGDRPGSGLSGGAEAPSLADRERLDLGDLESSPGDPLPPAPKRHADLSDLGETGGWAVTDMGETEPPDLSRPPWARAKAGTGNSRRVRRYGVVSMVDVHPDQPIIGGVMSYEEAVDEARALNILRETMTE